MLFLCVLRTLVRDPFTTYVGEEMAVRTKLRALAPLTLLVVVAMSNAATAQTLNKENFREYLNALENVDEKALTTRFYHEEFSIIMGDGTMGLAGLLEYEKSLKALADFHFEVHQIVADESGIAIDAIETFDVLKDADIPNIGPARKGERWALHLNVFYSLRDGRISTIKANVLSVEKIE
jgi:predicted ester cyclase